MRYVLDIHCHSIASGHAYSTITENVNYAKDTGLELIAITDHTPRMPGGTGILYFSNLHVLPRKFENLELLIGAELNIMDDKGTIDLPERNLKKLDLRIASLHLPCISHKNGINFNTEAVINTMQNPYIDVIGHLGDDRYLIDMDIVIEESIKTGTLIEINNSSLSPTGSRVGGKDLVYELARKCKKRDIPVVLGTDAHYHTYIGNFGFIEEMFKEIDFPDDLVLNTSVEKFKKHLKCGTIKGEN